jgi:Outer membrane protein beta-barrel domain
MKSLKLFAAVFALIFLLSSAAKSQYTNQTSKKTLYPQWSVSPVGGAILPVGILSDNFKPGGTVGLDIGYKVNKEVGFYAKIGYYFLTSKITGAPIGNYLEYSFGPRYFLTKSNLKSNIFLEGGVGGYTFMQNSYINPADTVSGVVSQISDTRPGLNAGIGANLALSKVIDIVIKSKYNILFTPNGSNSFITLAGGLGINF